MLTYSAAVTLYLAYVGLVGVFAGILLWPAVVLHAILTALLARAATSDKENEDVDKRQVPSPAASPRDGRGSRAGDRDANR